MRLTKAQAKAHQQAMDLVHSDRRLTLAEREFILDHYQESQGSLNSLSGAFFTPSGLARDFALEVGPGRVIDLCAGIGRLAYACQNDRYKRTELVCIERCPEYVEVGKRILPEAVWICGDVFDPALYADLGRFDWAISNPPFGRISENSFQGAYSGGEFEFKVIEQASRLARYGTFIVPQLSAPFRYSGERHYREEVTDKLRAFMEQTGIALEPNCGIDTAVYRDDWHGVSVVCEIVLAEFAQPSAAAAPGEQIDLFGEAA